MDVSLKAAVTLGDVLSQRSPIADLSNDALVQEIKHLEWLRDNANEVNDQAMLDAIVENAVQDRPEVYSLHDVFEANRVVSQSMLDLLTVRLDLCKSERDRRHIPIGIFDRRRPKPF